MKWVTSSLRMKTLTARWNGDFFGWEYVLARHIGLPIRTWLSSNSEYGVESERELSDPNNKEICHMLHGRVQTARKAGIVKNFKPLAIR
jgi:hypothetical protein